MFLPLWYASVADGLKLYSEKGEKREIVNSEVWVAEKKKLASETSQALFDKSEELQKKISDEEARIKAAKANGIDESAARKRGQESSLDAGTAKKAKTSARGRKRQDKRTMYINRRIAKAFQQEDENGKLIDEIFFGTIDKICHDDEPIYWHVQYDDDDEEEFDERDIKSGLELYARHEMSDPRKSNAVRDVESAAPEGDDDDTPDAAAAAANDGPAPMDTDENEKPSDAPAPSAPVPATTGGNAEVIDVDSPSPTATTPDNRK